MPLPIRPRPTLIAATALAALLGACHPDRAAVTGSVYPTDYRARHPIVLADGSRSLDVFVTGPGHLDPRQAADVDAFMMEYRRYGRGGVLVEVPRGVPPALAAATERTGEAIRRMGAEAGVPARDFALSGYAVAAPEIAAPVRISFRRMEAKVADTCGLWPRDLGTSSFAVDIGNQPHWNLGCATQANLAAQVADPVDLVRGRTEGRIDSVRRVKDIDQLRNGKDPSIAWRQDGQNVVKSQVGN